MLFRSILGWRVDGLCTAIYLQSVGEVDALRILNGSPEFRKHLEEIGFVGPVIERPDGFTAWQVEKEEPHSKSFSLLLQNFQQLLGKLEKTSPGLRNYIGIGRPYQGILGLQKSLNEARESCTIAQLSGKPYDAQHIDEMGVREDSNLFDVIATLHVERDSQKGIIIGPQGSKLKAIGTLARKSIENLVGMQVFLQIHVKVSKEWQKDPKMLARLGFTE